jgi:hypothetical protein
MAPFVWMLLAEPSYKPNTLTARSLAGEESKPEDLPDGTSSEAGWLVRRAGNSVLRELSARVWGRRYYGLR